MRSRILAAKLPRFVFERGPPQDQVEVRFQFADL